MNIREIKMLANHYPAKLLTMISNHDLIDDDLALVLEVTGSVLGRNTIISYLDKHLTHPSPMVREGAIFGIGYHLTSEIEKKLKYISNHDSDEGVREAAQDILEH